MTNLEDRIAALEQKAEAFAYTPLGPKYKKELEELREDSPSGAALSATERQEQIDTLRQKVDVFESTAIGPKYEERLADLESDR